MSTKYINDGEVHYHDLRERLYWNKYLYRGRIRLPHGARYSPKVSKQGFVDRVTRYWLSPRSVEFIEANPGIYERYHDWRTTAGTDLACRREAGYTAIYSNDLELLRTLSTVHDSLVLTKAVVATRKTGVKFFRSKPKHDYRVYLRSCHVSLETFTKIHEWLRKNSDKFSPSPALARAYAHQLHWGSRMNRKWLSSQYFIDYDVESLESILQLMWGEYLGAQYRLLQYNGEHSTNGGDMSQDNEA